MSLTSFGCTFLQVPLMETLASMSDAVHALVLFVPCHHRYYGNGDYEAKLKKMKDLADLHGAFKRPTSCCWGKEFKLRQGPTRIRVLFLGGRPQLCNALHWCTLVYFFPTHHVSTLLTFRRNAPLRNSQTRHVLRGTCVSDYVSISAPGSASAAPGRTLSHALAVPVVRCLGVLGVEHLRCWD